MSAALDLVRQLAGAGIGVFGLAFILLAVIGALRFPDAFTRAHVLTALAAFATIMLVALAILAWDWRIGARLALLAIVIWAAAPMIAHATAGAAHAAGLAPIFGDYAAPRPGAPLRRGQGE